ncbi:hypothetical protein [Delftia sp.]|uniref:hypothetical protein n=1 Tax=Delftia sp. TaxID=1886637 RepID=UPI00259C7F00|nr:hypothetical protein [Delftia sp.]
MDLKVWNDFIAQRKAKRAPLTDTALEGIATEANNAGISLNDAIAYRCPPAGRGSTRAGTPTAKARPVHQPGRSSSPLPSRTGRRAYGAGSR